MMSSPRCPRDRLVASRRAADCGVEGLVPVFRRAEKDGLVDDYDNLDDYLEAVLEGEADDVLPDGGWRPCAWPRRCRRARRCLRHRG